MLIHFVGFYFTLFCCPNKLLCRDFFCFSFFFGWPIFKLWPQNMWIFFFITSWKFKKQLLKFWKKLPNFQNHKTGQMFFFWKKTLLLFMEKHQTHLLLSFFFHMIGEKKSICLWELTIFYTTCQKGNSLQCLHSAAQTVQKHEDKNNTGESVKEREIRERERERDTQEGKNNKFCCKSVFFAKLLFQSLLSHYTDS